jgi:hypothetical protein
MSVAKQVLLYGLEAQVEPSYKGAVTFVPATDAVLLAEPAVMTIDYLTDGTHSPANATASQLTRNPPAGRFAELPIRLEFRGRNAAYDGTTGIPQDIHALMRGSGHSAVFSATPTPQYTYAPESDTYESLGLRAFARAQQYDMKGVYCDMGFSIDGPEECVFEFNAQGLITLPTDVALPALTYATHKPPLGRNIALTVNAVTTLITRSIRFAQNRQRVGRANINESVAGDAHAGYAPGRRGPTLDITVESTALATFNPYSLRDLATSFALEFTIGSVQYNRFKFSAPAAQIISVSDDADDPVALWTISLALGTPGQTTNDEYSFLVN